jgi:flagellar protein FlaF
VYSSPLQTYESVNKQTMSGRELEASILNQAALRLKNCQENWDAHDRDEKLMAALDYNQQVWSILQSELVKSDHPLPDHIRRNLLNLSVFVDKRIFETMAFPSPEKLTIIIDINRNIAAGLMQSSAAER